MVSSWAPPAQDIVLSRQESKNAASLWGIRLGLPQAQIAAYDKGPWSRLSHAH